jgi:hypothetical protein
MHRRTLCCPLQMVQYLSQTHRSSGKSHCAQTVGPCIGASEKTVPEQSRCGKLKVTTIHRVVYLLLVRIANSHLTDSASGATDFLIDAYSFRALGFGCCTQT